MTEFVLDAEAKRRMNAIMERLSENNKQRMQKLIEKERVTLYDIDELGREDEDTVPLFCLFSSLKPAPRLADTYKATPQFTEKTRLLRLREINQEYKKIVRDVDPLQRYGQEALMENFGTEMRTMNKQLMSVFNVLITVVCAFFFGFSGITFLYPGLNIDIAIRFIIGLVCATIVFFADLYFVVKSMDDDLAISNPNVTKPFPSPPARVKKEAPATAEPTEEIHVPLSKMKEEKASAKKRKAAKAE